jgi:hypothetical protein
VEMLWFGKTTDAVEYEGRTPCWLGGHAALGRSMQATFTQLRRLLLLWLSSCMSKRGVHRGEETMYIRKCVKIVSTPRHSGCAEALQNSIAQRTCVKSVHTRRLTRVRRISPAKYDSTQVLENCL